LRFFREQDLKLPRPNRFGDVVWKQPTLSAILLILPNPAYAGAFVYGRTHTTREISGKVRVQPLPMQDWKMVVKDKYPACLDWKTYERIRKGQIQIEKDQETGLYLFPDCPETLEQFQMFKSDISKKLLF
jgi:hypothetical protein